MKKSNSKSKYIHGQCVRVTIPLKLESNETSEAESEASSSQTVSDDGSADSSDSESDPGSFQSSLNADSEAAETVYGADQTSFKRKNDYSDGNHTKRKRL